MSVTHNAVTTRPQVQGINAYIDTWRYIFIAVLSVSWRWRHFVYWN